MKQNRYKICKSCGAKNLVDEIFCIECMGRDFEILLESIPSSEYKICKSCGAKNSIENEICDICLDRNFEKLNPQIKEEKQNGINQEYKTVRESNHFVLKVQLNNQIFQINSGDIVGREAKLSEMLQDIATVSREHIKFILKNNNWLVQDLNSTNGTLLNNTKLNPLQKYKLNQDDILKLSSKITMTIKEI